jgi:hypothetical protein
MTAQVPEIIDGSLSKFIGILGGTYCHHLQGQRLSKGAYILLDDCLAYSLTLKMWQHISPKHKQTSSTTENHSDQNSRHLINRQIPLKIKTVSLIFGKSTKIFVRENIIFNSQGKL